MAAYGKLPLSFEANQGQAAPQIKFLVRGAGYGLALTPQGTVLWLRHMNTKEQSSTRSHDPSADILWLRFANANPQTQLEGELELPGRSNYFRGRDPQQWRIGEKHYSRVRQRDVYPGVDVVYYGQQQQLEYDLIVAPGADPSVIRLQFDGSRQVSLGAAGQLQLQLKNSIVEQQTPVVYQESEEGARRIPARYRLLAEGEVGIELGPYNRSQRLVIDPVITYTRNLGGNGIESAKGITIDADGNVYVAGYTTSTDFPLTPGALQTAKTGIGDVFITKLNATGSELIYSTYLGSYQEGTCCTVISTDGGQGIDVAIDAAGSIYVTGYTNSRNFPVTPNALQTESGCPPGTSGPNCRNAFVTKLSATGDALIYSTYFGGSTSTAGTGIVVDATGHAYVCGTSGNGFVIKLNPTGTGLLYSTSFGGGGTIAYAIAVDSSGQAYVTGGASGGLLTTPGAFQRQPKGSDAFVVKVNAAGTDLAYATYLGGNDFDRAFDLAIDVMGNAYVVGYTMSQDFPTTIDAFQPTPSNAQEVFVTKLNATGMELVYSTYLGGSRSDLGFGIAVDAAGAASVTGNSASPDFPRTPDAFSSPGPGAFVTRLDPTGTSAEFSSFLGDNMGTGYGIAVDTQRDLYLTGVSITGIPLNSSDIFITKVSGITGPMQTVVANVSAASYTPAIAPDSIVAAFGPGLANMTRSATETPLPTVLGGVSIKVKDNLGVDRLAPLFFVSPEQVNYQIPAGTSTGSVTVTVERAGISIATQTLPVTVIAPGLFAANADGRGEAAAVALRLDAFGRLTFEPVARFDPATGRMVALPLDLGQEGDQLFLILFGTGLRNRSSLIGVTVQIGGTPTEVIFAGAQPEFVGLDQINVRLPRSLAGRGEVDVTLTVDGNAANVVRVSFK